MRLYFAAASCVLAFETVQFAEYAAPMEAMVGVRDDHELSEAPKTNFVSDHVHALAEKSYYFATSLRERRNRGKKVSFLQQPIGAESAKEKYGTTVLVDDVDPMENQKNSEYIIHIRVGSNNDVLMVAPDSGSTNLHINSEFCKEKSCTKLPAYSPSKSDSARKQSAREINVGFGTAALRCYEYTDTVKIGNIILRDHAFGAISYEEGGVWNTINMTGILGLSFPAMNHFKASLPFFDRLMQEKLLRVNQFSFFVSPWGKHEYSAFLLGEINPFLYKGNLSCFPVRVTGDNAERFWIVDVNKVTLRYKDDRFPEVEFKEAPKRLIFDSGTNLYSVDNKEDLIPYLPMIPANEDQSIFDRKLYDLPTIVWELPTVDGDVKNIAIQPDEYYVVRAPEKGKKRGDHYPGFMNITNSYPEGPSWMFGQLFMRYWMTIYRRGAAPGTSSVCVAPVNMDDEAIDLVKDLHKVRGGKDTTVRSNEIKPQVAEVSKSKREE